MLMIMFARHPFHSVYFRSHITQIKIVNKINPMQTDYCQILLELRFILINFQIYCFTKNFLNILLLLLKPL